MATEKDYRVKQHLLVLLHLPQPAAMKFEAQLLCWYVLACSPVSTQLKE